MNPSEGFTELSPPMATDVCANIQQNDNIDAEYAYSQQSVPFTADLNSLAVGQLVCVTGTLSLKCKRFSINFICSKDPNSDIAFHFNPRLEQRYIVRNCRVKGYWGPEETSSIAPFDFDRGKPFKADFFIAPREFMVSVNGQHWCSFTYRVPLSSIVALDVRGLVDVGNFEVKTIQFYPEQLPNCEIVIPDDTTRQTFNLPYLGKFSGKFEPGWEVDVIGRTKLLPQNFYINLQEAPQLWPHPNIPLHLNPRFCTMNGIDVFVRNAWVDGSWGQEERAPICPFLPGKEFLLHIRHEYDAFTVWISDQLIAEFKFRYPTDKIEYVQVAGDVEVFNVSLHQRERQVSQTSHLTKK